MERRQSGLTRIGDAWAIRWRLKLAVVPRTDCGTVRGAGGRKRMRMGLTIVYT